jgi:hypothetical protein
MPEVARLSVLHGAKGNRPFNWVKACHVRGRPRKGSNSRLLRPSLKNPRSYSGHFTPSCSWTISGRFCEFHTYSGRLQVLTHCRKLCQNSTSRRTHDSAIHDVFHKHEIPILATKVGDHNYLTDGDLSSALFRYLMLELKNEGGSTE